MLTEEIWKDVEGYEKLYQVSNLGRVRSLGRDIIRNTRWGTSKPYHIAGKVLKILRAQADYRYDRSQIRACCQGKPRYQTAGGFRWRYKVITTDNGKS